jgi:hypothetical protein
VLLIAAAVLAAGCGASPVPDPVSVTGRRVQATTVVADSARPYRVAAYELVFAEQPGRPHARRAAVLVNFVGGQGYVQGFAEWGRPGEAPTTYVVGGSAHERSIAGERVMVLNLALDRPRSRGGEPGARDATGAGPVAVRVVVKQASGEVSLTRIR